MCIGQYGTECVAYVGILNCVKQKFTYSIYYCFFFFAFFFSFVAVECVFRAFFLNGIIYFYLVNSCVHHFTPNFVNETVNFAFCMWWYTYFILWLILFVLVSHFIAFLSFRWLHRRCETVWYVNHTHYWPISTETRAAKATETTSSAFHRDHQ